MGVGRDRCPAGGAGPAQAGVVDDGGQFGSRSARGDSAQIRQIRTECHLHRESQRAGGGAVQHDAFRPVRVAGALHDDVRVRACALGDTRGGHEACAIRRGRPGLDCHWLTAGDTDLAPGEHAPACAVEALQPLTGQLPLVRGNGETRERDADDDRMRRGKHGRAAMGRGGGCVCLAGTGEGGRAGRFAVGGGVRPCLVCVCVCVCVCGRRTGSVGGTGSRSLDSEGEVSFGSCSGVGLRRCSAAPEVCRVPLGNLGSGMPVSMARSGGPALAFQTGVGAPKAARPSSAEGGVG